MRRLTAAETQRAALASLLATASSLNRKYATQDLGRKRALQASQTEPEMRNIVGRKLNLSSALLSLSVLADSGLEHYRGSFQNRLMYLPLGVSAVTFAASLFGMLDARARSHVARDSLYGLAALTGAAGLGFHVYNILKGRAVCRGSIFSMRHPSARRQHCCLPACLAGVRKGSGTMRRQQFWAIRPVKP